MFITQLLDFSCKNGFWCGSWINTVGLDTDNGVSSISQKFVSIESNNTSLKSKISKDFHKNVLLDLVEQRPRRSRQQFQQS